MKKVGAIESILFAYGESLSIKELSKIINENESNTLELIKKLEAKYKLESSGIELIYLEDRVQLSTKLEHHDYIEKLIPKKNKKKLSQSTMEVLAIIAYKQPITKSEIDQIRGVKSDKSIMTLLNYDLIFEKERLKKIGRPIVYATTENFLKKFGYNSLKELPDINLFSQ